jgi:hypothetical protein
MICNSLPQDFVSQTQSAINLSEGSGLLQQNSQSSQYFAGSRYAFRAPVTHISQFITLPEVCNYYHSYMFTLHTRSLLI